MRDVPSNYCRVQVSLAAEETLQVSRRKAYGTGGRYIFNALGCVVDLVTKEDTFAHVVGEKTIPQVWHDLSHQAIHGRSIASEDPIKPFPGFHCGNLISCLLTRN